MKACIFYPGVKAGTLTNLTRQQINLAVGGVREEIAYSYNGHAVSIHTGGSAAAARGDVSNRIIDGHVVYGPMVVTGELSPFMWDSLSRTKVWPMPQTEVAGAFGGLQNSRATQI